jgi:hypothetical protein
MWDIGSSVEGLSRIKRRKGEGRILSLSPSPSLSLPLSPSLNCYTENNKEITIHM